MTTGSSETTCFENGSSKLLQNVARFIEVLDVILRRLKITHVSVALLVCQYHRPLAHEILKYKAGTTPRVQLHNIVCMYTYVCMYICMCVCVYVCMCGIYRVSQEECARLWEKVPYVKVHRYNPKHLYPKLNGYRDNGQRSLKV